MSLACFKKGLRWWQLTDLRRPLWAQAFLKALRLFYGLGQKVHQKICFLKQKKASLPVISIGSVCAGGSGKTPLCAWLYDHLKEKLKPLIVMRGYGFSNQGSWPYFIEEDCHSFVGDEAWMLSGLHQQKRIARAVALSPNRWMGCQKGKEKGFEAVVLDDGMQHYALYRDIELTLLDPEDIAQDLLPAGRRREPWSALQRSDWILFRSKEPIEKSLRLRLQVEHKPYARFSYSIGQWKTATDTKAVSTADFFHWLSQKKLGVCTGIARPQNFLKLLLAEGLELLEQQLLADHEDVSAQWLLECEQNWRSKGIEIGICTEKDYARWSQKAPLSDFWVYPELKLVWHESEEALLDWIWSRLLSIKESK